MPSPQANLEKQGALSLLESEDATLLQARHAIHGAISSLETQRVKNLRELRRLVEHGALLLEKVYGGVLQLGTSRARVAGLDFLRSELRALGIDAVIGDVGSSDFDAAIAGYVEAWTAAVWVAAERRVSASALREAERKVDYRLRTGVVTETARAFTDAHAEAADQVPGIVLRWSAILDRRTCPTCAALDGEYRRPGRSFKSGMSPGNVHPMCRCFEVVEWVQ